jgi:hypothetical protein
MNAAITSELETMKRELAEQFVPPVQPLDCTAYLFEQVARLRVEIRGRGHRDGCCCVDCRNKVM